MRISDQNKLDYQVKVGGDTAYRAAARLLQNKWREKQGYPVGKSSRNTKYGNYIEEKYAREKKVNFLTDNIREQVDIALKNKEDKSMINESRLWENMLSSQPLCFNIFGELAYDLDLATLFFKMVFSDKIKEVTKIRFEHSNWRENTKYTGDKSAFDVFVEYTSSSETKGFLGIEVKYAESLREESQTKSENIFKAHEAEYRKWTIDSIFKNGNINDLKSPPLSQIWRDHLLAISVIGNRDYDEGCFIFLYPKKNTQCEKGINKYKELLVSEDIEATYLCPAYIEDYINTLHKIIHSDWTKDLKERYLGD